MDWRRFISHSPDSYQEHKTTQIYTAITVFTTEHTKNTKDAIEISEKKRNDLKVASPNYLFTSKHSFLTNIYEYKSQQGSAKTKFSESICKTVLGKFVGNGTIGKYFVLSTLK